MRMILLYYNCTFALFVFRLHKLGIEAHAYAHYTSLLCFTSIRPSVWGRDHHVSKCSCQKRVSVSVSDVELRVMCYWGRTSSYWRRVDLSTLTDPSTAALSLSRRRHVAVARLVLVVVRQYNRSLNEYSSLQSSSNDRSTTGLYLHWLSVCLSVCY